ncbi:MAG: UMP kinase [Methanobacteriaceae archaeon]|jgi:uridylate kinase|nr:UMP kinase [Candidatus Methanorudis spinitermitis]
MRIVAAIGGSIIIKGYDYKKFQEYAEILIELSKEHEIFVVVGGGQPAREYIKIARDLGCGEAKCDDLGIEVTKLNAKLLILALDEFAFPAIPHNFQKALEYSSQQKIVVMGGTEPAHSTDTVGAILAEYVKADIFINLTSVDGMYDKDPNKYSDANLIEEITAKEMLELIKEKDVKAGTYEFFDMTAIQMIKRSSIETVIANGNNPENLIKIINKEKIGTRITFK